MTHAFMDESKRRGLLVAVAVFEPSALAPARAALRQLCLPGQSRLHFTKERDERRRQILSVMTQLAVVIDLYDATGVKGQREARTVCLNALVRDLASANGQRLVLERDDSLVRHDQAVLFAAVREVGRDPWLRYEHLPARSEPLLWAADAAAWCWSRGGAWRDRLHPLVRNIRTL